MSLKYRYVPLCRSLGPQIVALPSRHLHTISHSSASVADYAHITCIKHTSHDMLTIHAHNEEADKDVVKGVLVTLNHVMCITPPIDISEIDRLHRVGKPEANRTRPVLIKFATYRSKRRVLEKRRVLNHAKRTEAVSHCETSWSVQRRRMKRRQTILRNKGVDCS